MAFILGASIGVNLPTRQAFTVDRVEGKEDLTSTMSLHVGYQAPEALPLGMVYSMLGI